MKRPVIFLESKANIGYLYTESGVFSANLDGNKALPLFLHYVPMGTIVLADAENNKETDDSTIKWLVGLPARDYHFYFVYTSSPQFEAWKTGMSDGKVNILFMNFWTWAEFKVFHEKWYKSLHQTGYEDRLREMRTKYVVHGPIPRVLLGGELERETHISATENAVVSSDAEKLQLFKLLKDLAVRCTEDSSMAMPSIMTKWTMKYSHSLFHFLRRHIQGMDQMKVVFKPASTAILARIIKSIHGHTAQERLDLFQLFYKTTFGSGMAGALFESIIHDYFDGSLTGPYPVDNGLPQPAEGHTGLHAGEPSLVVYKMTEFAVTDEKRSFKCSDEKATFDLSPFPKGDNLTYLSNADMHDHFIFTGKYYKPQSSNNPGFDALFLRQNRLHLLQMTVSVNKDLTFKTLRSLLTRKAADPETSDRIWKVMSQFKNWRMIYVIPSERFQELFTCTQKDLSAKETAVVTTVRNKETRELTHVGTNVVKIKSGKSGKKKQPPTPQDNWQRMEKFVVGVDVAALLTPQQLGTTVLTTLDHAMALNHASPNQAPSSVISPSRPPSRSAKRENDDIPTAERKKAKMSDSEVVLSSQSVATGVQTADSDELVAPM